MLIVSVSLLLFAGFLCWPKFTDIPLQTGGILQLRPESLLGSIFNRKCTIRYKPAQGNETHVDLLQTFLKWPLIVIPSTNSGVFLCLYYNDVDVQLLKLDTRHTFKTLPANRPVSQIVLAASCEISEASGDEWNFTINSLKQISPDEFKRFSFGIFGIYSDPQDYIKRMQAADEIMYDGDVGYPDPHHKGKLVKHPSP